MNYTRDNTNNGRIAYGISSTANAVPTHRHQQIVARLISGNAEVARVDLQMARFSPKLLPENWHQKRDIKNAGSTIHTTR